MDTEEVSNRYVAPCFVNRLEAYAGEIKLGMEENMISNEFGVKLCLEHECWRRRKDWDLLLDDLDFGDIPDIKGVEVSPFVCKMGKSRRSRKKGTGHRYLQKIFSTGGGETFRWRNEKEEEEAIIKIKGEALIEKEDPGAFVIPIRLEGKINLNALSDTGSDINVMPYRVYIELGREELKNVGVATIVAKFIILDMPIERDTPIIVGRGFLYTCGSILNTIERITSTFDGLCHQTFRVAKTSLDTAESDSDEEEEYAI
ncbi:hypothetical protein Tco_0323494 [Tanacetum coccineum]